MRPFFRRDFSTDRPQHESNLANLERWMTPQEWQSPSFENSWVDYDAPTHNATGYWKDPFGVVHLRGIISGGTIGLTAFTLPEGFRPPAIEVQPTVSNDAFGRCDITADGEVNPTTGSTTWFALDGITFRALETP